MSADEAGVHLLVADRKGAYAWRTAASLVEPGFATDGWIGHFSRSSFHPKDTGALTYAQAVTSRLPQVGYK